MLVDRKCDRVARMKSVSELCKKDKGEKKKKGMDKQEEKIIVL